MRAELSSPAFTTYPVTISKSLEIVPSIFIYFHMFVSFLIPPNPADSYTSMIGPKKVECIFLTLMVGTEMGYFYVQKPNPKPRVSFSLHHNLLRAKLAFHLAMPMAVNTCTDITFHWPGHNNCSCQVIAKNFVN